MRTTASRPSRARSTTDAHDRRWLILGVLCLSVFLIVVDGTIVNVALPTLVRDLGATTSQLQWIVDAYTLVFAGLLLAAGSLGDRLGRKGALLIGLALFGAFSAGAAWAGDPSQLIAWRSLMGVGAALIFPATLAILVNVFRQPKERAAAIGIWAAVSGLAVALGPVTGGFLLEHAWWGSVFLVNVPIVVAAMALVAAVVPTSRDPHVERLDPLGLLLSVAGVTTLVWAVIEAPTYGWTSAATLGAFAAAAVLLAAFVAWQLRCTHPMLDVRIFRNARFTAGTLSVALAFFALFGFIFMVTQYFQFVRGYGTLSAGLHTVPFAVFTGIASPLAAKAAGRFGTKRVVALGLASMGVGFGTVVLYEAQSPYALVVLSMLFMGGGLGLVNAPATEAIMGSLPPERAGVGSAVNDTSRELGGTLGVAVVGSLFASAYGDTLGRLLAGAPIPPEAESAARESMGAALAVAEQAPAPFDAALVGAATEAFMDGFKLGSAAAAVVALAGAVLAMVFLPAQAEKDRTDQRDDEGTEPVVVDAEPAVVPAPATP